MKINKIALAISLAAVSSISQASLTGMNLNGLASFAVDDFSNLTNGSAQPYGPMGPTYATVSGDYTDMFGPTGSSGGGLFVTASSSASMLHLTSQGESRLYDSGAASTFSFDVYVGNNAGVNSVDLLVKSFNNPSDGGVSASLVGAGSMTGQIFSTLSGPTSASEGSNSIHTYSFDLGQTLGAHKMFTIEFNTAGSHTSYDAFAVVANPVPVPAAAWLFGSALLGLAGLRKKK